MRRIRRRTKRKILIIIIFALIIMLVGGGSCYYIYRNQKIEEENELKLIKKIKSHYSNIVEVSKDSSLYEKRNGKFIKIGTVAKGEKFSLEKVNINIDTKYFKIKELGYYIEYESVKVCDSLDEKDTRYKNYIVFNENVITKDEVGLYRGNKKVYTLNFSLDEEIVIKDDNGYFIEYFGELLFVKKDDILNTHSSNNTTGVEADGIPVTVYHFIYLEGDNTCNEGICHSQEQIKEHFNYLRNNNFFTMTTTELRLYLEGKLRVPKKSILITIDDGARAHNFIPLLEEYKINATLFLISSWYPTSKFKSDYMELASHTHNLHTPGVCSGGQGSPLKCLDKTKLLEDLKNSRDTLSGTEAFCFPFYEYNDYAISVLKEAGFKMAFIGGYRKARRGDNLYKVPRIPLNRYTTLQQYASYIN